MVKNGQNCPKIGEIIGGGPSEKPNKNIGKMAKNAPAVQSENAPKRVKMAKNDQKSAKWPKNGKNCIKNRVTLQLPCKGVFHKIALKKDRLRRNQKSLKNNFAFGEKKSKNFSRLRREF